MTPSRKPPLAFVDESGQPNLDVENPSVGTHFILTAVLVEADAVDDVRAAVDVVREKYFPKGELRASKLASKPERFRSVLEELGSIPFKFYAVVVDKREIRPESGLAYKASFYKFLSGLLYRKLFGAFPDLNVTADAFGRDVFMESFARYLLEKHCETLFDRPRVTFANSRDEPLVQLADVICGALARTYDATKTDLRSAELLQLLRPRALMIEEWPVRYRAASGTGSLLAAADPGDDDVARFSVARAEDFLEAHEATLDRDRRAQVLALKKLLFELRFGDPNAYVAADALREVLVDFGEHRDEQWLRSTVIGRLRDAGVLIASTRVGGYKIPNSIQNINAFVALAEHVVPAMLQRVTRARDAVLLITSGRVDVLEGEHLDVLRRAVEAIPGPADGGATAPEKPSHPK